MVYLCVHVCPYMNIYLHYASVVMLFDEYLVCGSVYVYLCACLCVFWYSRSEQLVSVFHDCIPLLFSSTNQIPITAANHRHTQTHTHTRTHTHTNIQYHAKTQSDTNTHTPLGSPSV